MRERRVVAGIALSFLLLGGGFATSFDETVSAEENPAMRQMVRFLALSGQWVDDQRARLLWHLSSPSRFSELWGGR